MSFFGLVGCPGEGPLGDDENPLSPEPASILLTVTPGPGKMELEWEATGDGAESASFTVLRCEEPPGSDCRADDADFQVIAGPATNKLDHTDEPLLAGWFYCYQVTARYPGNLIVESGRHCNTVPGGPSLTVQGSGTGDGRVISMLGDGSGTPTGIDCTITGGVASGSCTRDFGLGTVHQMVATAASGSTFEGWGGSCTGEACTVALNTAGVTVVVIGQFDLVPPPAECAGTPRTGSFTDADFDQADWTAVKFFDTSPEASFGTSTRTDEGYMAPPSYSVKHSYCGVGGIVVGHWNTANTFDPGGDPAEFVSISYNARMFPWATGSPEDMVLRVMIKQGDSYYLRGAIEIERGDNDWTGNAQLCMNENQFFKAEVDDPDDPDAAVRSAADPDRPDFSLPMQFGFSTHNSSPTEGACVEDREALVDNFVVEVH